VELVVGVTVLVELVDVEVVVVSHSASSGVRQPPGESSQQRRYCGKIWFWSCPVKVQRARMARQLALRHPRSQMRRAIRLPSQFLLQRS